MLFFTVEPQRVLLEGVIIVIVCLIGKVNDGSTVNESLLPACHDLSDHAPPAPNQGSR